MTQIPTNIRVSKHGPTMIKREYFTIALLLDSKILPILTLLGLTPFDIYPKTNRFIAVVERAQNKPTPKVMANFFKMRGARSAPDLNRGRKVSHHGSSFTRSFEKWLGLFEQRLAKDKWNVCRFRCSAEMGRLAGRA